MHFLKKAAAKAPVKVDISKHKFGSKPKVEVDISEEAEKPKTKASLKTTTSKPALGSGKSGEKKGFSFIKRGAESTKAMEDADAKQELAKQQAGKMFRFRMQEGQERKITFLDGDLDEDGIADIPTYNEHTVKVNGNWTNFVCTTDMEGWCPICNAGEYKAALVGVYTVIDHTPYTVKNGPNAGKTYEFGRKLFVAKRQTLKVLQKHAVKKGGLAGCTFDVTRTDDKSPSVGNQFDFVEKLDGDELSAKYGITAEDLEPAVFEEEIVYHSAEELVALGVGKAASGPGMGSKSSLASKL